MQQQVSQKQEAYVPDWFMLGDKNQGDLYNRYTQYLWENSLAARCPCCRKQVDYGQRLMLTQTEGSPRLTHLSCLAAALQSGLFIATHQAIYKKAEEYDDQLRREEEKRQKLAAKLEQRSDSKGKGKDESHQTRRLSLHKGLRGRR